MEKKEIGNSRFFARKLQDNEYDFIHYISEIDHIIDQSVGVQRADYDIHFLVSENFCAIARMIIGFPSALGEQQEIIDEVKDRVIETKIELDHLEPKLFTQSVRELLQKNNLKNLRIKLVDGQFDDIQLISSEMGSLNWP